MKLPITANTPTIGAERLNRTVPCWIAIGDGVCAMIAGGCAAADLRRIWPRVRWYRGFKRPYGNLSISERADTAAVENQDHASAATDDLAKIGAEEEQGNGQRHQPVAEEIVGGRLRRNLRVLESNMAMSSASTGALSLAAQRKFCSSQMATAVPRAMSAQSVGLYPVAKPTHAGTL